MTVGGSLGSVVYRCLVRRAICNSGPPIKAKFSEGNLNTERSEWPAGGYESTTAAFARQSVPCPNNF